MKKTGSQKSRETLPLSESQCRSESCFETRKKQVPTYKMFLTSLEKILLDILPLNASLAFCTMLKRDFLVNP
jgi:hypothetical protein